MTSSTNEPHEPSLRTYRSIAKWGIPDFFFSTLEKWERFGILGVFGDMVLESLKGDILEVGVGESSIYLTELSRKYQRRIYHCDLSAASFINRLTVPGWLSEDHTYVEETSDVPAVLNRAVFYAGTSDTFFARVPLTPLALAFIDGDHRYEQVKRDFHNVVPHLVNNGYILLHDTDPKNEHDVGENRCGTVYRLRQELEQHPKFDCLTLPQGCAMDVGLTIARYRGASYYADTLRT